MSTALNPPSSLVDPVRWPDVARIPRGVRADVATVVAERIFRHAVSRLGIRVMMPDGTVLGGDRSGAAPTMYVHEPSALARRIGSGGLIGFGESYLAGEWDSDDLAGLIAQFASSVEQLVPAPLRAFRTAVLKRQPAGDRPVPEQSRTNVERHYDLSNEMFATFLDETMTYSSALFDTSDHLTTAQRRKIDRLLDQAGVGTGSRLLEIGSGWGGLALRAAQRGAIVDSITLSTEQQRWANDLLERTGLGDRAHVSLSDYRDVTGTFDAVVSVEMIEAVGLDFLDSYFDRIAAVLRPGGRAAVQAIVMPHHRVLQTRNTYTWIHKYIFPGGALPSMELIEASAGRAGLRIVDDLAMGDSYARTLDLWAQRFDARADELAELGFDNTFRRMWDFYLRYSEGGFRAGYLDVHQLTFVREGGEA
ncbi:class I SAM-dependent methyltransferase [Flexivirga sp. ID2601S]|uniref:Class I SAM-dependent methyltransferase n=1 Tax=Flexivirga aerilata TaxID=1656889 RepID=A0A849AE13_9MICO|nr:cyclopropane-fatty-acyl-phospholipid synthase family protein [Flexivirga aerilata]NNG39114.1 class I SAM-dependent methyltransferase [Flexivirga aerilata]